MSRNLYFYNKVKLKDTFESRIYLIFFHFSVILIVLKLKKIKFSQKNYDNLFHSVENDLRELGFGDVSVNKKMKELNKIFYDILLKVNISKENFSINRKLVYKYFDYLNNENDDKYDYFKHYFDNYSNIYFEINPKNMIKDAINFRIK